MKEKLYNHNGEKLFINSVPTKVKQFLFTIIEERIEGRNKRRCKNLKRIVGITHR